jgi:hypothetical protein
VRCRFGKKGTHHHKLWTSTRPIGRRLLFSRGVISRSSLYFAIAVFATMSSPIRKRLLTCSALSASSSSGAAKKKARTSTCSSISASSPSSPSSPSSLMPHGWADFRRGDDATNRPGPTNIVIAKKTAPSPPKRNSTDGRLLFADFPDFQPNKTPREVLEAGAFGGCYFRPIPIPSLVSTTDSDKTKKNKKNLLKNQHLEFDFFQDLPNHLVCATDYDVAVNKYRVACGGSLQMWMSKGWIAQDCDPYGWFQWYCRFYSGRRCSDDARQVKRWLACTGPKGRWKRNLLNKVVQQSKSSLSSLEAYNDPTISPVVRQTLLHWAYEITKKDLEEKLKEFK